MDKLNIKSSRAKCNFYFDYREQLLESMIVGSCLNVSGGSHIMKNAVNIDEGLPNLPYADNSFDTVICSDMLEYIGHSKQAVSELLRVAREKIIIIVPAYEWLYGKYDDILGRRRRYRANDFTGFEITHLFWFLVPFLFLRKLLGPRYWSLPRILDSIFFRMSKLHLDFGTTILAEKHKVPYEAKRKHKISMFIPVFNEERIIDRDIRAVEYIIRKLPTEYEVFIVNDSSKDKTKIIAEKIERTNRKVKLLNYERGPTRRENLAQSFKVANGDIVVFVDVDLIGSVRFLPDLIDKIILGYDIATGSRYVAGSKIKRIAFRLIMSLIYNTSIKFLFRTRIHDHLCGFKAFKRNVLLELVDEMGYDKSLRRGIFWDTELLIRARRHGYKIKEIPIRWRERNKSALYFRREAKTIGYVFSFMTKLIKERNV